MVSKAASSLRKVSELVNHLLDTTRIQSGRLLIHFEPLSLNALLHEVIDHFHPLTARHTLTLIEDEGATQMRVMGDRSRLEQVLNNLLDNAVKYSPAGGPIQVTLSPMGDEAVISVSDRGIGVPAAQQPWLFDRLFRAHNAPSTHYGGLGLGLYISRDIIDRHQGRIWMQSEEGRGSTFFIALPRLVAAHVGAEERSQAPAH